MAKTAKATGVVEFEGEPIRKTNRFFLSLRSYGQCDENGKTVMGIQCSAKRLPAPPDRPLALIAVIVEDLFPAMRYSSKEAMEKDLVEFQRFVANLRVSDTLSESSKEGTE